MAGMAQGKDVLAFRRTVEAELRKLGVEMDTTEAITAVSTIAQRAIIFAGDFHDHVMHQAGF